MYVMSVGMCVCTCSSNDDILHFQNCPLRILACSHYIQRSIVVLEDVQRNSDDDIVLLPVRSGTEMREEIEAMRGNATTPFEAQALNVSSQLHSVLRQHKLQHQGWRHVLNPHTHFPIPRHTDTHTYRPKKERKKREIQKRERQTKKDSTRKTE